MNSPVPPPTDLRTYDWRLLGWVAAVSIVLGLLYSVAGALLPFMLAVIFAYMGAPLVDRLTKLGLGRTLAAVLVLIAIVLAWLLLPLLLLPLLLSQLLEALALVPAALTAGWETIAQHIPGMEESAAEQLRRTLSELDLSAALPSASAALSFLAGKVSDLVALFATLVITPFVSFFLLRDWQKLLRKLSAQIPAQLRPTCSSLAQITDSVLGEFLRGQASVMLIMTVIYCGLLLLAGTPYAIAIGTLAGVLTFIPFVGFILSLGLAVILTFLDFESWQQLLFTVIAMGIGTSIESFLITPNIVGDRIGLGPVAVLFALSVFGAAFGFIGMLLALPAAAVALAFWRYYLTPSSKHDAI